MSAVLCPSDASRELAQGFRMLTKAHPERAVTVDREFLCNVLYELQTIAHSRRETFVLHVVQGHCKTLAGILGELLEVGE